MSNDKSAQETRALVAVMQEIRASDAKWPSFNSAHEALGVLLEEVDEFKAAVYLKQSVPERGQQIYHELMQVAAVAIRGMRDLDGTK